MIGRKTLKQIWIGLFGGMLLLTSCAPAGAATPVSLTQDATATPFPRPTNTSTSLPTGIPTSSITPLPTIPTFTPTFDTSTIVTVTPTPKADCPELDLKVKPEDYLPEKIDWPSPDLTGKILEFLNSGGNSDSLLEKLDQIYRKTEYSGGYAFRDLTGDQAPEFLYVGLHYVGKPIVFSCVNGKYELTATLSGQRDFDFYEMEVDELNFDGIPEVIITGTSGVSHPAHSIYLYRWDGRIFATVGQANILSLRQKQIRDVNGDGMKEVLLIGDNPVCVSCSNFIPQRERTITYSWNGRNFVEMANKFTLPKYRFQAVQDADDAVLEGNYERAIQSYLEIIDDKDLDWWSPERFTYEQTIGDPIIMFIETPSTIPTEELTEYPRLAAYAYYRVVLLYIVQGNELDAEATYKTLQEKFSNDPYGSPYVEMATMFCDAYQSTRKLYNSCAAAIQYATEHPEILIPLGSDYHGWQSHTYVPADVCPFR